MSHPANFFAIPTDFPYVRQHDAVVLQTIDPVLQIFLMFLQYFLLFLQIFSLSCMTLDYPAGNAPHPAEVWTVLQRYKQSCRGFEKLQQIKRDVGLPKIILITPLFIPDS